MRTASSLWTSRVAAFLAVALLSFAGVKSAVMQVQMAAAPVAAIADCGMDPTAMSGMPGMRGMHPSAAKPEAGHAPKPPAKADCPYCADASHAPLIALAEPLRPPSSTVFVVALARPPLGARAPPPFQPRARGPPPLLQTA